MDDWLLIGRGKKYRRKKYHVNWKNYIMCFLQSMLVGKNNHVNWIMCFSNISSVHRTWQEKKNAIVFLIMVTKRKIWYMVVILLSYLYLYPTSYHIIFLSYMNIKKASRIHNLIKNRNQKKWRKTFEKPKLADIF